VHLLLATKPFNEIAEEDEQHRQQGILLLHYQSRIMGQRNFSSAADESTLPSHVEGSREAARKSHASGSFHLKIGSWLQLKSAGALSIRL